ncbi:AAA family ATPase [Amycolatopsis sp. PS_44_ISF1]|nr:AAA family ATPase [Amycolatopsis sp. PS_44_ISF1]
MGRRQPLVGRRDEIRVVEDLIEAARLGRGGALVLNGEAGIGKSALLEHAQRAASGFLQVRAHGSQFESELPFATLHQLDRQLRAPGSGGGLSDRHRAVLDVAFGLAAGPPDVARIGLAALELMTTAARERPLLCVVDDAHWLDAASLRALAFTARRVSADPVVLLMAARPSGAAGALGELPGLDIGRLGDSDALALLETVDRAPLDEQVRAQIVAESRGNPLALLHPPATAGYATASASPMPNRIEQGFRDRLAALPRPSRLLLTIASADPTGDPGLLWAAAQQVGLDVTTTGEAAAASGLVTFSTRVRFCHPLARSAVYLAADDPQRRTAHHALAEVTDPELDPDRRAWHRAAASAGPDEDVAAELQRSASRARSRGGTVAAAAFLERAAELSLIPGNRIKRTIAAAQARFDIGALDTATALLATLDHTRLEDGRHADADLLRGRIAFARHHDQEGANFMIRASRRLATADPKRSRECLLDALETSVAAGRPDGVLDLILAEARSSAPVGRAPESLDILDALPQLAGGDYRTAMPLLRKTLQEHATALCATRPSLAVIISVSLCDPDAYAAITEQLLEAGRKSGSPITLRLALAQVASSAVLSGDVGRAMAAIAEEEAITDATDGEPVLYHRLHLAAIRGRRKEAMELIETARAALGARGTDQLIANVHWAAALLHNGLSEYPAAFTAARQLIGHDDVFISSLALPELVEAAARCGKHDEATAALETLTVLAEANATDTALGVTAYARGLVTGDEEHYREAVHRLEKSPALPYRARAHLLYGEWLRRENRRKECRPQLRTAHTLLSEAGMEAFAGRAAGELLATGEKTRGRLRPAHDQLTMQEMHIARLVAAGGTSIEVANRLFISRRTVDAHLRNILRKLDITSRRQLGNWPDLRTGAP